MFKFFCPHLSSILLEIFTNRIKAYVLKLYIAKQLFIIIVASGGGVILPKQHRLW